MRERQRDMAPQKAPQPPIVATVPMLRPLSIRHAPLGPSVSASTRIGSDSLYFDAILALIPARIYFGPDEDEKEGGWSKYARVRPVRAPACPQAVRFTEHHP